MWGATTPKLKKKCIKFANIYNEGGGPPPVEAVKFNNIMNIINILLISIDLEATGKIITCTGKKEDPTLHGPRGGGRSPHENLRNL